MELSVGCVASRGSRCLDTVQQDSSQYGKDSCTNVLKSMMRNFLYAESAERHHMYSRAKAVKSFIPRHQTWRWPTKGCIQFKPGRKHLERCG
ncbi:hypothetical protein TNCV_303061 [Trichonephila clavipes]|nr:hypothetical protein TNCV_303061 [Trichonephila clavipes]